MINVTAIDVVLVCLPHTTDDNFDGCQTNFKHDLHNSSLLDFCNIVADASRFQTEGPPVRHRVFLVTQNGEVCAVDASVVQFARAVRTWKSGFALQLQVLFSRVCNQNYVASFYLAGIRNVMVPASMVHEVQRVGAECFTVCCASCVSKMIAPLRTR